MGLQIFFTMNASFSWDVLMCNMTYNVLSKNTLGRSEGGRNSSGENDGSSSPDLKQIYRIKPFHGGGQKRP